MVSMYTARTSEIDEIDDAISEIKEQIDFTSLKKNTGGLIFCHLDFIESGLVEALCQELPWIRPATEFPCGVINDLPILKFLSNATKFTPEVQTKI